MLSCCRTGRYSEGKNTDVTIEKAQNYSMAAYCVIEIDGKKVEQVKEVFLGCMISRD